MSHHRSEQGDAGCCVHICNAVVLKQLALHVDICVCVLTSGKVCSLLFARWSSCRAVMRPGSSQMMLGRVSNPHADRSKVPAAPSGRSSPMTASSPRASITLQECNTCVACVGG